jgi:G3E family GTPase
MSSAFIDVFLITGFLGSGKTTFLCQLLTQIMENPQFKIGVLINEFGTMNVDSDILPKAEINFLEINGGSIFCSCLHTEFIESLKLLHESTEINTLFVEASGLSNPSMIFQDLNIVKQQIGDIYKLRETICLIDSSNFMKLKEVMVNITTQVQVASIALINKIDLVDSRVLALIEQTLHIISPSIKIFKTNFGKLAFKKLGLSPIQKSESIKAKRDTKGGYQSLTMTQTESFLESKFIHFINQIKESTFRIKGNIQLEEKWYRIDGVEENVSITPLDSNSSQGRLVIIYKETLNLDEIQQGWNILGISNQS